jgi:uncharacterized protein with ParB-like and HNH nuclease domain
MDLKGAKIVNFYRISGDVQTESEDINKVRVPHYQRPYSWDKNMVRALIEDWLQQDEKEYFAGSIVTVAHPAESYHELVDGQQRFTTIFLTNYLLYLLLRVTTRQAIIQSKTISIEKLLERLDIAEKYLFEEKKDDSKQSIFQMVSNIEELEGKDKEDERDRIVEKFRMQVGLPQYYEGNDNYKFDYKVKLYEHLKSKKLLLSYDRKSFVESLHSALSRVLIQMTDQNEPVIEIIKNDITAIEKQYTDAVEQIFLSFKTVIDKKKPFEIALGLVEKLSSFMQELKVCVVQTGDSKDAYTLFEVLNDRSKPLSDLDLIKNQFYKNLCLNSNETDDVKDVTIEKLESQWGDEIYKDSPDYRKKFITYFATSFLTGDISIGYSQNDKYRDVIKKYLERHTEYPSATVTADFNVFQACEILIDTFNIKFNDCERLALQAEYDLNMSPAYKTVQLLVALKFNGVLAAYFNLLLNYISKHVCAEFSKVKVTNFAIEIVKNNDNIDYVKLNEQAIKMTQLSLLHNDFKKAKVFANKLIVNNHRLSTSIFYADDTPINDENRDVFFKWLDAWQYGSNFRIRILFAKLLSTSLDCDVQVKKTFSLSISADEVGKLQLDHMEPISIKTECSNLYFDNESRDYYVNSLGNMFPLPGGLNGSKSNKPFKVSFDSLLASGLNDHWLTNATETIFVANNVNDIPTVKFFDERKSFLKSKFYEVLNLN